MSQAQLQTIADELANHETYADAVALRTRSATFGELALEMLAIENDGARALRDALAGAEPAAKTRLLLDVVVRDAIARGAEGGALLAAAAERFTETGHGLRYTRALPTSPPTSVWEEAPGILEERFRSLFADEMRSHLAEGPMRLRPATARELEALDRACSFLTDRMPEVFESALAHVDVIALTDVASPATTHMADSCSWVRFPATIFLTPLAFIDEVTTAELLLHEAVHHKHYELRRCRSILADGYEGTSAATVVAPWNPAPGNRWATDRAISAGHVYTYQTLLYALCADPPKAREAAGRARHLLDEALALGKRDLGADGVALVQWLADAVARMEPVIR